MYQIRPIIAIYDRFSIGMASSSCDVPLNDSVRKIFIQRDYTSGLAVKFDTTFPQEFIGVVDPQQYCETINEINRLFNQAESLSISNVAESVMACLSAFLIYTCFDTHYNRCLKRVKQYIEQQNELVWRPKGLEIRDPMERGLRVIEITLNTRESPVPQTHLP